MRVNFHNFTPAVPIGLRIIRLLLLKDRFRCCRNPDTSLERGSSAKMEYIKVRLGVLVSREHQPALEPWMVDHRSTGN